MVPSPGQIVRARSRRYLVEEVVSPPASGHDTLVRLSCLDDDAQGELLEVLWEREVDAEIVSVAAQARVAERGFDAPRRFAAYLDTLRWSCTTATNPRLFQSPYRAGIEVMAYQLEPLRKALLLPRVNLFVADDVGLGKTIEAGLVVRELILRQKVRRIVVACPPSVVVQWQGELEQRFGLRFVILDRDYVIQKRRERGYGVNAWSTHTRFIVSHALLRDEAYAGPLRDWLAQEQDPGQPRGTLLILDEAHNAAPASGSKYAIDSRFTKVVREIAPLFEHRLFLSATPHNGHSNSFSALLEILDPHRFCRGVKVAPKNLDAVMVRRLKGDLREIGMAFPERKVVQVDIADLPEDAPDLVLARLLDEYRELREAKVKGASKRAQAAATIVLTGLQKRLLSSIEAFASTLRVHRRAVERAHDEAARKREAPGTQLAFVEPPGADDEEATLPEAEIKAQEEEGFAAASEAMSAAALEAAERDLLDRMTRIAEDARGRPDPRVQRLAAWIRERCCPNGTWITPPEGDKTAVRRILIFTEFADTKRYLDEQLRTLLARTNRADERIATFHGGMDDEGREEIKRAFNAQLGEHPLRVLIATDAAREGVNLQNNCADLFHFDVPWNPSRMEQRNGRIDRKLQRAPEVRCHYFVYAQRPEDRVLGTLVKKTSRIQDELGSLSQVLEVRLGRALEEGIRRRDVDRLAETIEGETLDQARRRLAEEELEQATRARQDLLRTQMEGLRNAMADAKSALHLEADAFAGALSEALSLLGARGLGREAVPHPDRGADKKRTLDTYLLPTDDARLVKDPSWTDVLDSLRRPRARDEKPWEWRKAAPIRPLIFEDPGSLDERFVHVHLEHRLAQRLLGRFLAQGFVHDDLARAVATVSTDPIRRVVLLGRLSLYGDRAARLHDEIIAVAARWIDPETRREPLKPYADDAKARTLDLVDAALLGGRVPDSPAQKTLTAAVARDVSELFPHLGAIGEDRARRAEDQLFARGGREAEELTDILALQKKRIQGMLTEADTPQLAFGFSDEEKRQLEADVRHWKKRVAELDAELGAEPPRVRASYEVRARRVDPIGIVYLWPSSG